MSLDDPFGRSAAKNERDYQELRSALVAAGIDSRAQVASMRRNVLRNALLAAAIVSLVLALVGLFLPRAFAFVAICAGVVAVWLVASTVRGRAHLARYLGELDQP